MNNALNDIPFGFDSPWWLLALGAIPLWLWFLRWKGTHRLPALKFPGLADFIQSTGNVSDRWPKILNLMMGIIFILIILALGQPRWILQNPERKTEGIDIVIAMDISLSMLARDFEPNRLEESKNVAARFINERGTDRMGLVIFSGQSFTLCPLTADKAALITLLQQAQAGFIEDGSTAIGDGIATAINRLRESEAKSKVIILLTDGENNAGNIDPLQAAEIADMYGIRLYTIGVGSRGTAIGPVQIIGGNLIFGPVEVDIDEPTLRKAAEIADGKYFRATDGQALYNIYQEIDLLEKSKLDVTLGHARLGLFQWFLFTALILMPLAWFIRYKWLKLMP
jgi:Ca-activated chloride channel homolog